MGIMTILYAESEANSNIITNTNQIWYRIRFVILNSSINSINTATTEFIHGISFIYGTYFIYFIAQFIFKNNINAKIYHI